ncbi:MAG: DUF3769 domain-containing protein [Gloeotrichia echinulata DVL01]|jgi:lipopolysaccharide export system protein LptA|nr:DUF3769 domain-containing protein [Gloeotrichia echinulata DEX184]
MLHPVLPPAPLPILEPLPTGNLISSADEQKAGSVVVNQTKAHQTKDKSNQQREISQFPTAKDKQNSLPRATPINANQHNLVVAQTRSAPNPPETFPPEFSPLTGATSAELLGQGLVIGYPMQHKGDSQDAPATMGIQISEQITTTQSNSKNLFPPPLFLTQQLAPQKQPSDSQAGESSQSINPPTATSQNRLNSQPLQNTIQFKSRSPTPASSTPRTIEFSPPSQPTLNNSTNQPQSQSSTPTRQRTVEVISDKQVYDEKRRVVTAEGNVVVRFDGAVVDADRLQVNLDNLIAVGQGNVALTRGDQVLRGERFTYNFIQDSGELFNGRGEVNIASTQTDFAFLPTDVTAGGVAKRPASDRITANQPLANVTSPGGIEFNIGGSSGASNVPPPKSGGTVNRVRFEAERIEFYPRGWQAKDVTITNDPFSPPELQFRAAKVTLTQETPLVDNLTAEKSRLVFDQNVGIGIPRNQQRLDRRQRSTPFIVDFGYDGDLRGGLFIERSFDAINTEQTSWTVTPQFFIQKAVQDGTGNLTDLFGLKTKLNVVLNPKAVVQGFGEITTLDFNKLEDNLKASLRLRQTLGERLPHTLNLEYSYRDRLYNGTLGFQTVQSSFGGVISSPVIPLGNSGINLSYQGGAQYINANTDRPDLLQPNRKNDRISLTRFQGSAALSGGVLLWQGKPLPPTATAGLRYSPRPVVPYLRAIAGVTGTTSYYTNGDDQSTLIGTVGLEGQIGHFSRPYLDYTAWNISYSQGFKSGLSPFLFDRAVDTKVLTAGITQQIYGPFRLGLQTSVNLDSGRASSTDYILEYNRRTYGITLRYNPVLELGAFSFRISDFNWSGGTDPFSDEQVKPVVGGVRQDL